MGQEVECRLRYQKRTLAGKAYLETDYVLFRGEERIKILLKDVTLVEAAGGRLTLTFDGGPAEFELGKAAEKWRDKILHPPSRLDKLGVKAGLSVRLVGDFPADFTEELSESPMAKAGSKADLIFLAVAKSADLGKLARLLQDIKSDGALWVIYPKGVLTIREIEVIEAGRDVGLKDVKVANFSTTHTALKFVIPVADR
jgi:hypothetical protein